MIFMKNSIYKFSTYLIKSPLALASFREPSLINITKASVQSRFRNPEIVDELTQKLTHHKQLLHSIENTNKQMNNINKNIKQLMKSGKALDSEQVIKEKEQMLQVKTKKQQKQLELDKLTEQIEQNIMKIGNIVHPGVPVSLNEEDNLVKATYEGKGRKMKGESYHSLGEKFSITDLKRGQKVSGHRGYYLKHNGVKLALSLTHYAINFLTAKGYELHQTPAIIMKDILQECCQLNSITTDMYELSGESTYLIATSQQSLAGYHRGQVLRIHDLPVRMGGYSTCFRKEAGAHGKDIQGLFRVHQFEKVQQFVICQEKESEREMQRMIDISEEFYRSLELPYRVVDVVSGELNDAAARKYDLEAWYPSQQRYRELVSVSNCTDYQSRLLKVQYHDQNNKLQFPHMLNGTLVAIQRTLTCLLENYHRGEFIEVPTALQAYMQTDKIYPFP